MPAGVQPTASQPAMLGLHGRMGFPGPLEALQAKIGSWILGDPNSDKHIWIKIYYK